MTELSTILRQRLGAAEKPTLPHPDADVLTAFAEELLPAGEREQVLKHLTHCGDCRDVLALTMPDANAPAEQEQEVLVAAASVRRRRWFMTPAFGLAGSIAVMIVGLALILQLPQKSDLKTFSSTPPVQRAADQAMPAMPAGAPLEQAKAEEAAVANPPLLAPPQVQATSPARAGSLNSGTGAARGFLSEPRNRARTATPVITADMGKQDYVNRTYLNAFDTQMAPPNYGDLPPAPMPIQPKLGFAPPSVVAGSSLQAQNFDLAANAGRNQGVVTLYPSPSPDHGVGILGKIVDVGKRPLGRRPSAPIPSNSLGASAMFKPQSSALASDAIAAKSSEQASGGMLAQSPAFSSTLSFSRRALLTPSPYQWKVVEGKLLKSGDLRNWSEENPAGENVQFSVVSANGPEIWAGGKDAALMHSHDGGSTWERVTLGASATGTINSIEAAGLNLHVRSSSGQSWASQDGGKSWSLQD